MTWHFVRCLCPQVQKKIHVLDERGTEVNPHTGRPRRVPKLRVLEVPVPSYVQPGHWFTYVLAGVGHVRCKAPKVIADLGPGLAGPRRPQMLVAVPELEMRAIHDR